MILNMKMLDVEVLGWCGYTWSAVVRPVGCTAKCTALVDIPACQLHAPSKLATSVALCCVIKLHILECPFIVASLTPCPNYTRRDMLIRVFVLTSRDGDTQNF